jgi:hypothetical protein
VTKQITTRAKIIGFSLSATAVITACCVCLFSEMPIPIEHPVILVVASLFLLIPFASNYSAKKFQKIVGFYLTSVLVNELSLQNFQLSGDSIDVTISYSAPVFLLCIIAYMMGKIGDAGKFQNLGTINILPAWLLAVIIIIFHMAFLTPMLMRFYGYGYERNLSVLGSLCLYFLLFVALWGKLDMPRFRQFIGVILTVFYFVITFAKR